MSKFSIVIFTLMACSAMCYGQQFNVLTDTVEWKANSLKDLQTDTVQSNLSKFITYGSSKIVWIQHEGEELETVMTFLPDSTDGDWNSSGYFHAYCSKNGRSRTFRFENHNGNKKVIVSFAYTDGSVRSREFTFSEARILNNQ
jgi:hypothetical protein